MIVLIYPDCNLKNNQKIDSGFAAIQPNIYMALLCEYIKSKGIDVVMIDSDADNLNNDEICLKIEEINPSLIGIVSIGHNLSLSTITMYGTIDLSNKLKARDMRSKIFIAGGHPSVLPERTLQETNADYIIIGEGYNEIVNLHNNGSKDKFIFTKSLIRNVEDLPSLNWSILNPNKYRAHNWHCLDRLNNRSPYGVVWTSLGGPYPCNFCAVNNLFGEQRLYRKRDMKSVMKEIDVLVNDYGVTNIKIIDDLFVTQHPRIEEFCNLLR